MRLLVPFLLILSLVSVSNAQSFLPATLITRQGDTLPGYVRADYSPIFVRFKSGRTELPVNYEISSINGLIVEGLVYERKVVTDEILLMQKLVSGKASLFVLRQKPFRQNRYFLEKGTAFVELVRKSSETVVNGQLYAETYQNHLALFSRLLNDCNAFNSQQWPTDFGESSFVTLVSNYNNCTQKENAPSLKNSAYPAFKAFPTHWFINAGMGLLGLASSHVKSSLNHYTYKFNENAGSYGGYVKLEDQGSKPLINRLFTVSTGFERTEYGKKTSWGSMISYSAIDYKHSINTKGLLNYYPNDYTFTDLSGNVADLPPATSKQPIQFEGESYEKASVIQADVFLRYYWTYDKAKLYVGTGAGYGLISSTFQAPVRVYLADGSYQGMAVRDIESVTALRSNFDFLMQIGWLYSLAKNGQSAGLSVQYNSLQSNRISLLLTYAF